LVRFAIPSAKSAVCSIELCTPDRLRLFSARSFTVTEADLNSVTDSRRKRYPHTASAFKIRLIGWGRLRWAQSGRQPDHVETLMSPELRLPTQP
jgi:hypothetical protein